MPSVAPILLEEPPKLVQPRSHKAKVSLWADITVSDMDIIDEAQTPDLLKDELARIFQLEDYKENMKNAVLIDLYFYTIQFCRDHKFSKEQTSAVFSIIKQTHEVCIETPFGNVEQTFDYFKELVLCHAVKRPPFSIDLFAPIDVKNLTEYVINTYFRHFKMYKYVFTPLVRLDLSMQYRGMPPTPEPSEHGDEPVEGEGDEAKDGEEEPGAGDAPATEQEESAAAKEFRKLIKQHLSEEINKLKQEVDQQIKESEEVINQKLAAAEPKSGRASGKGKKR